MVTLKEFQSLALSLPQSLEVPHFDKVAFKVKNKIFATLNEKEERVTLKFTPEEQGLFCKIKPESIFPVPNKWGKQGWTHLIYKDLNTEIVKGLLEAAFITVAPKSLSDLI